MAVDFAHKQRTRGSKGFALRNIKLRLSRKLIFVSGLLACFSCHLDLLKEKGEAIFRRSDTAPLVEHLRVFLTATPLEVLARLLLRYPDRLGDSKDFFTAYDEFLGLLGNRDARDQLENLTPDELATDPTFDSARLISHRFRKALYSIFLEDHGDNSELYKLMIEYGVF